MNWRSLRSLRTWLCIAAIGFLATPARAAEVTPNAIKETLRSLAAGASPTLQRTYGVALRRSVERFYAELGFAPAWLESAAALGDVRAVIAVLGDSASHGLAPQDYGVESLANRLDAIRDSKRVRSLAELDVALSLALFQLVHDLRVGRIDPRSVHRDLRIERPPFDHATIVRRARATGSIAAIATEAAPSLPAYDLLRSALARYRALSAHDSPALLPITLLRPGSSFSDLTPLRDRLVLLGDLDAKTPISDRYDGPIVDAVVSFQRRHGLAEDGVIGPATQAALSVPIAQRVRQIELALERLRWLPPITSPKVIVVNIPEYRLRAIDAKSGALVTRFQTRVIVGRAAETRTPVFRTYIRGVEINPCWNIPASITSKELLPLVRRDPRYLERENMEVVTRSSPVRIVFDLDQEVLARLERGELRLRQRPGPTNALGRLKFSMPNALDIYLHDTPAKALFQRSRRDFSHGCIRIEAPEQLAAYLLDDQDGFSAERIRTAMASNSPDFFRLTRPTPILLFYSTVVADPDGTVLFLTDLYGHDTALAEAIATVRKRRAPRNAS